MARRTIELSEATVVVAGRAVTPVARVTTTAFSSRRGGFVRQRLRPARIEVVGPDGRHRRVPVPDVERQLRLAIAMLTVFGVFWRLDRRRTALLASRSGR